MDFEWCEDVMDLQHYSRTYKDHLDPFTSMNHQEFRYRFRLNKETVREVISQVKHHLQPTCEKYCNVTPELAVLITLRFYAGATFQTICGDIFSVSQSSVSRAIEHVTDALMTLRETVVKFPPDRALIKQKFFDIAHFPGVIGCIDGTHIPLCKPRNNPDPEIFRCRKGYFSLNVQVVAGPENKFYDVVARWPGSTHDSRIFGNSYLCTKLANGEFDNDLILADGGYPCLR
jgi:hypothetical protein